jgi:hypothetical protein
MKIWITIAIIALTCGIAIGAGVTKIETKSKDASSAVGYGSADAGDTIVRIKTDANGVLQIKGV